MSKSASSPIVKIHIIRHGETQENLDGIIQGQLDTKLNETGLRQAAAVAGVFKDIPLIAAFSSDLERARKTAEVILEHHPSVRLVVQPELRERFMGELQGYKVDRALGRKMHESKEVETGPDFTKRTLDWWETTIAANLPFIPVDIDMVHVLVVSHGAFIATLVRTLLLEKIISGMDPQMARTCFNTSVTAIEMGRDKRGVILKYADFSHLAMPAVQTNADETTTKEE